MRTALRSAVATGVVVIATVSLTMTGCSEGTSSSSVDGATTTVDPAVAACEEAATIVECVPEGSMLADLVPDEATRATGEPIRIGMINQDTGASGAFPELTTAATIAVEFINTELDGVDGRPIELVACNTNFNPDLSQSCAQQMVSEGVAAVIGGIDIWGTGIETLQNNGIPYVGGIPVSFPAARSPVSFQFSGGSWGAVLGMGQYAIEELDAQRIAIIYGEFGPITDAAQLGKRALEAQGAEVTLVTVAPVNADMVQALNTALQADPDVVIALTADSGCKPTMLTAQQIGVDIPIMYTGACAAPKITDSVGDAAEGAIFNLEADLEGSPDNDLYQAVVDKYGEPYGYEAQGAGTVTFRATINLYTMLRELGAEAISAEALLEAFRAARDEPSFFGHPYTCDGEQLAGYAALCAPQQSLGTMKDGAIEPLTGWIDVAAFVG